jgi:CRP/FNR family transcriptional regulator, cyclic AMP receptor protein
MDWPLLQPLDDDDRRELLRSARRRRFHRNEIVFHEGDPGNTLHLIDKGHLAMRSSTPLGDVVMVRLVGPGDHFGEMALIDEAPRSATVVALDDVETLSLHADVVTDLRQRHPRVDNMLLLGLSAEVRRLANALVEALHVPADKRVLRRLLDSIAIFTRYEGDGEAVTVPLTQDDFAQLAGTTRPTANRVLRAAQDAGSLRLARGRIEILDIAAIRRKAR